MTKEEFEQRYQIYRSLEDKIDFLLSSIYVAATEFEVHNKVQKEEVLITISSQIYREFLHHYLLHISKIPKITELKLWGYRLQVSDYLGSETFTVGRQYKLKLF